MEYSDYQKAIFREVKNGEGNIAVIARAGSGKTESLIESLKYVPKNKTILCTAFNKAIAGELKRKSPAYVDCQTFHSTGFRAIKNKFPYVQVDEYKTRKILEKILEVKHHQCIPELLRAVSLAKASLKYSPDQVQDIIDNFSIDFDPMELDYFISKVIGTLSLCKQNTKDIDYDDMIWYPFVYDMYIGKWDYIFVDEFQDLNHAQLHMSQLAMKPNSRIIFTGDPRQNLYNWRGADSNQVEIIFEKLKVKELPLPMTYRCPKVIVELAKEIVPDYECPESAIDGKIHNIKINDIMSYIKPGSYFLSRYNAPLIKYCMMFIKHNIPSNIQGRDVANNLLGFISKSKSKTIENLIKKIDTWKDKEVKRLSSQNKPISDILDRHECLQTLCSEVSSISDLKKLISQLFIDVESDDVVVLSTIHRIKGKQSKNVFVLKDTLSKGSNQSEDNIYYVAITRTSENLYFVEKG